MDLSKVFLFLTFIVLTTCKEPKLKILPNEKIKNIEANKDIALTCQGESDHPEYFNDFKWFNPIGEVTPSHQLDKNYAVLLISKATTADSGEYKCEALFQNTKKFSASIQINVYQGISWDNCPSEQNLIYGSTSQKIICKITSQPGPIVTWKKNNKIIEKNSREYSIDNDGIRIKGAVKNTSGGQIQVTALLKLYGDHSFRTINVRVIHPPKIINLKHNNIITLPNSTINLIENEKSVLSCNATGIPQPRYYWLDALQRNLSEVNDFFVDPIKGELVIEKLHKSDYMRNIFCIALNPAGENKANLQIKILSKPEIIEFNNITDSVNKSLEWKCKVRGEPLPKVSIRKYNEDLISQHDNFLDFSTGSSENDFIFTLKKDMIRREDDGLYICKAENDAGNAFKISHLRVQFPPDLSKTKSEKKAWGRQPINLTCIAESIPNPIFSWRFNEQILEGSEYTIVSHEGISNLEINLSPEKYGLYYCTATNELGEKSTVIRLTEAKPPLPPTLEKANQNPNFIKLQFARQINDDDEVSIKQIHIKYWKSIENEEDAKFVIKPFVANSSSNIYFIKDLVPNTQYNLKFACENDVGIGYYSDYIKLTTPSATRPDSPQIVIDGASNDTNVNIHFKSNEKISIRWMQANDNGKKILSYTLSYRQVDWDGKQWIDIGKLVKEKIFANSQLEYYFARVKPNSYYKVELQAHNALGDSPPSSIVFRTSSLVETLDDSDIETSAFSPIGPTFYLFLAIGLIVLILFDLILYVRCHVGAFYFLRVFVCSGKTSKQAKVSVNSNSGTIMEVKDIPKKEINNSGITI